VDVFAEDANSLADLVALGGAQLAGRDIAELRGKVGEVGDGKGNGWQYLPEVFNCDAECEEIVGELVSFAIAEDQHLQLLFDGMLRVEAEDSIRHGKRQDDLII